MAVLTALQSGTSSNQNLVTGVTIQGYAASAGRVIKPRVYIAQLNGAAATLTIGIRNTTDSSWVWRGTWIKGTAADTIAEPDFPAFIANGKTYAVFVSSSNASDTTTPDITVDWFDMTHVDLDAVKGTSNNASGLGSAGGDYYNNTRFNANVTGVDGVTATWSGVSGSVLFLRGTTWSTLTGADVNAQCDTAMSDYGALQPTTAGRKLDVTAGGNAGIDWANIESPTTTVDLSGTTVAVVTDVFNTVTANMTEIGGSTNAAVGAALMGVGYSDNGKINANVTSMAANTLTASAVASDAATEIATAVRDISNATPATGSLGENVQQAMIVAAEASGYAQNIIAKLGAFTGTGINTVLGFFKALLRSDASAPSDVGGTFAPSTDSVEAIRDRGDAAWTTGTSLDAAGVRTAIGLGSANLDTQLSGIATSASTASTQSTQANTKAGAIQTNTDKLHFSGSSGSERVLADSNVTLDQTDLDAIVAALLSGLAGAEINYTGPVLEDGSIDLVEGDDYTSRPFTWTITGYAGPSLSGAAAVLRFIPMADYNLSGNTATAEVSKSFNLTQSGTTVTVSVAPTASDLAALTKTHPPLPSPNYKVQVKATSSNVTLVLANATRRRLIGPTA